MLAAENWIGQVSVTRGQLPGKPFFQGCHCAHVEVNPVFTQFTQVVKHLKRLCQCRNLGEFMHQVIAPIGLSRVPGEWGAEFLSIVSGGPPEDPAGSVHS
jgi:hypothetical protein